MHSLAAHGYHLLLRAAHLASLPVWGSLAATLALALATRVLRRPGLAALGGAAAVSAGWLVLAPSPTWPLPPVGRLSGLALLMIGQTMLPKCTRTFWAATAALAAISAWWLCGAPEGTAALADWLLALVGLLVGLAAARWLAPNDFRWGILAAALALAGSLAVVGASPHWALAALAPAVASLALPGVAGVTAMLSDLVVCVAVAALVASDRGRLPAVDFACSTPLLVWAMVRCFAGPSSRYRAALASALAVLLCVSFAWVTIRL